MYPHWTTDNTWSQIGSQHYGPIRHTAWPSISSYKAAIQKWRNSIRPDWITSLKPSSVFTKFLPQLKLASGISYSWKLNNYIRARFRTGRGLAVGATHDCKWIYCFTITAAKFHNQMIERMLTYQWNRHSKECRFQFLFLFSDINFINISHNYTVHQKK